MILLTKVGVPSFSDSIITSGGWNLLFIFLALIIGKKRDADQQQDTGQADSQRMCAPAAGALLGLELWKHH